MKKIISICLSIVILTGVLPFYASASLYDVTYINDGTKVTITGYIGSGGIVTIPDTIEGKPVSAIAPEAFANNSTITAINLSDSMLSIGAYAFANCSLLASVSLPNSITTIETGTFYRCTKLTTINIPSSVTSIGGWAFSFCTSLASLTVPPEVTSIGWGVFDNCTKLKLTGEPGSFIQTYANRYSIPITLAYIQKQSGDWTYIENNVNATVVGYLGPGGTVTIPSAFEGLPVTAIGDNAFSYYTTISRIIMPETVTAIGSAAFYNCSTLVNINLPGGLKSIGDEAFSNCVALTSINLPSGLESIGVYAFENGRFRNITLPESLTSLGSGAFYNCRLLTGIVIPSKITALDYGTFYSCVALTSVTLPQGLTTVGMSTFEECTSLVNIVIPSSVNEIGLYAFNLCSKLFNISLPDNLENIRDSAFANCTSLENIKLPANLKILGQMAFANCNKLKNIRIPLSVARIETSTFISCSSLVSAKLPEGLQIIRESAFEGCGQLLSVNVPSSVTTIEQNAFLNCSSIKIFGQAGSFAQQYASLNTISFSTGNANQSAPFGVSSVKTSFANAFDGKITGVSTEMEYKPLTGGSYMPVTSSEITGLAAGTYSVRYKASTNYNAGEVLNVTVEPGISTFTVSGYLADTGALINIAGMQDVSDSNGYFSISNILPGTYQLTISKPGALIRTITVIVSNANIEIAPVTNKFPELIVGDSNQDGSININDTNMVKAIFGRVSGAPDFNLNCDFTGDGSINVNDYNILKMNFGKSIGISYYDIIVN